MVNNYGWLGGGGRRMLKYFHGPSMWRLNYSCSRLNGQKYFMSPVCILSTKIVKTIHSRPWKHNFFTFGPQNCSLSPYFNLLFLIIIVESFLRMFTGQIKVASCQLYMCALAFGDISSVVGPWRGVRRGS